MQRTPQGGDGLEVAAHHHVFAVGDAAFQPAGVVAGSGEAAALGIVANLVVDFGTKGGGARYAGADFDCLHRLNRKHRLRQPPVQLLIPVRVRAQPRRNVVRHHLEDAAQGIAGLNGPVNELLHRRPKFIVHAADLSVGRCTSGLNLLPGGGLLETHAADGGHVTEDLDAERPQKFLRHRPGGHTRGGLARAGPLQNVARVLEVELQHPGQVGVARARALQRALLIRQRRALLHRQGVFPMRPIQVGNLQSNGGADGLAVADAGENLHAVVLDLHPPAASVAGLPALKLAVDEVSRNRHAQWQARHPGRQALPVRFPRCLHS